MLVTPFVPIFHMGGEEKGEEKVLPVCCIVSLCGLQQQWYPVQKKLCIMYFLLKTLSAFQAVSF